MPSRERVQAFVALVERGEFVEAYQAFYANEASQQENNEPPKHGLDALIAKERGFLAAIKEIRTRPGTVFLVDGDRAVINWVFDVTMPDGKTFHLDEVSWQRWSGDRILQERFFYDPAQRGAAPTRRT